jgi:Ca2+-transporting ATPase
MQRQAWHILSGGEICKKLSVEPEKGLSDREVTRRLMEFGHNSLIIKKGVNPVFLFLGQFKDFMVLVLMVATLISGLLGEIADAVTILAIILVNAVLGFIQEYRAEKSMESLRSLTAPEAVVLRNNTVMKIPAAELVPGDIVMVEAGDRVPADIRWLKTTSLRVEESALTGESQAVAKNSQPLLDEYVPIADRKNMGFMGTVAVNGRGTGIVIATGMNTEMGIIAGMMQESKKKKRRAAQAGPAGKMAGHNQCCCLYRRCHNRDFAGRKLNEDVFCRRFSGGCSHTGRPAGHRYRGLGCRCSAHGKTPCDYP